MRRYFLTQNAQKRVVGAYGAPRDPLAGFKGRTRRAGKGQGE